MRTLKNTLFLGLISLLTACSSPETNGDSSENEMNEQNQTSGTAFSIEGKAACEVVTRETIADAFDFPVADISSESYRDKDDHKMCRYEMRYSKDKIAALIISIKYNDRQDVNPNQYSTELKKALTEGLPVDGFKDRIQQFDAVQKVGTEAAYSGNMPDNKNLIFRINEDYFIRLEYGRFEDGKDIGDYKSALTQLAKALLQQ